MRKSVSDRRVKTILTNEEWYPAVNKSVTVSISELRDRPKLWKVAVWGDDDFGLEIEVETRMQALDLFRKIKDFTSQATLRSWGFYNS